MPARSPTLRPNKPEARSRVSNGKALFVDQIDGRSVLARRYRDVLAQLSADLGGDLTEAQMMIARRAATLAVWCEQAEAVMAGGGALDIAAFTTASNTLRRLVADLGLERRLKDVTPSLHQYLAGRERVA